MTTRVIIYPYKMESESAKSLARNLALTGIRTLRVRPNGSYRPRQGDVILNWGNSDPPSTWDANMLNSPNQVSVATNKLRLFQTIYSRLSIPDYTIDPLMAHNWIEQGNVVFARTILNGHSGAGIVIMREPRELVNAPLYVKYKKKRNEFRVHVFDGEVIDIQEKRREREVDRTADQSLVRSHANGWVFCRDNITLSGTKIEDLKQMAVDALDLVDLSFGAVDIIYNEREDRFYLLEINTAPGLEGQTLVNYTRAVVKYVENLE